MEIPSRNALKVFLFYIAWATNLIIGLFLLQPFSAEGQQQAKPLQNYFRVVNVEVPVRVFNGDTFVDTLTLKDFELSEDGVPQRIEALYLVKKSAIDRKEEAKLFNPDTSRHFYLFFICYEYTPKIRDAVNYFMEKVLRPDDQLVVVTPITTYDMKKEILAAVPREKIAEKLLGIVRKDILAGDAAYRSALNDLKHAVAAKNDVESPLGKDYERMYNESGDGGMSVFLMKYRADLERLEQLRTLDENKLLQFSALLKNKTGRKYVYLFYQREFVPVLDKKVQALMENSILLRSMVFELMEIYTREPSVDIDRLRKAYADSSITVHFLYLTTIPNDSLLNQMEEHSEDIYVPFANMAEATGGLTTSSSNAAYMMKKASEASEDYYLLYYSPQNKAEDGKFREINVRVKEGGLRVSHRAGYFAN